MGQWNGHLKETQHLGSGPVARGQRRLFEALPFVQIEWCTDGSQHILGPRQTFVEDFFHMCIFKLVVDVPKLTDADVRPRGPRHSCGASSPATPVPTFSLCVFQDKCQKS